MKYSDAELRQLYTQFRPGGSGEKGMMRIARRLLEEVAEHRKISLVEAPRRKGPMCEECDIEMHPFAGQEGDKMVEGWGCDGCGWSFDGEP